MKKFIFLLLLVSSFSLSAMVIDLRLGGQIDLSEKQWEVVSNHLVGNSSLLLIHKEERKLAGLILDGTIQTAPQCPKKAKKRWSVCANTYEKKSIQYYQISLEQKIAAGTFQHYIISFTWPRASDKKYLPIIKELEKSLEIQ